MRNRASLALAALAFTSLVAATGCSKISAMASGDGGSLLGAAAAAMLGGDFEGVITMQAGKTHGPQQTITFQVKPGKLRIDPPLQGGEPAHMIIDVSTKKMEAVIDARKMVMEMDMNSAPVNPLAKSDPATVTKTGKHESIAGYDCEHWDVKMASGRHTDVCVAQGIRFIDFAAMSPGGSSLGSWTQDLEAANSFPLSVIDYNAQNQETSRMTVTSIEKKALSDTLFTVPSDYQKMNLGNMMGGFPGGGPGGMPAMPHGGIAPPHGAPHH